MGCDCWPWIDAGDAATCSGEFEALQRAGVLEARGLGWLQSALQQGVGAPCGVAIPWAAWAMRISERALPSPAGVLAIAVTVLNACAPAAFFEERGGPFDACVPAGTYEAPDDVTRWSLVAHVLSHAIGEHALPADRIASWLLGLGAYPAASALRNPPLGVAFGQSGELVPGEQPPRARVFCSVREAVALWTAPALLAGEDLASWSRFGQAVAEPITLLGDLARLWLDPGARDLCDAVLTPLAETWLAEPTLGARLLRAYAGERASGVRRGEIHSLLASEPYRAHLACAARRTLASAQASLPAAGATDLRAAAAEFIDGLGHSFRCFDVLMRLRALLDLRSAPSVRSGAPAYQPSATDHALRDDAAIDVRMAVAFLSESAPWAGSWDVQRFGVLGLEDQQVAHWFVRGTILRALLEVGHDVRGEAARLLDEIPPGELRYYEGWHDNPPDADSLGLMLELAAATGAAQDRVETWIAFLLVNMGECEVAPTYFSRDPKGRLVTPAGGVLPGDDCNAVRLNLLCGLLAFDAALFDSVIQVNAARVLECSSASGVAGSYYYDASYAALAFLRFARLYRDKAVDRSLLGRIATTAAAIRARITACQRLDGGWGSPQHTAFCLQSCAMDVEVDDTGALLLERGVRYLSEYQLADGSWPAEPLYIIPLKRGRHGYHQGRALTTAFCARALRSALVALAQREHPDDRERYRASSRA
jgi:hypothetical protein